MFHMKRPNTQNMAINILTKFGNVLRREAPQQVSRAIPNFMFFLFLLSFTFGTRVIWNLSGNYIEGSFSYYLAIMTYFSDFVILGCFMVSILEHKKVILHSLANLSPKSALRQYRSIWLIIALLTILFNVEHFTRLSWYGTLKVLELGFVYIYVKNYVNQHGYKNSLFAISVTAAVQAMLGIYQFCFQKMLGLKLLGEYIAPLGTGGLSTIDQGGLKLIRAYGTFPHPNIFAAFLVFGLVTTLYLIVSRATKPKYLPILSLLLIPTTIGIFLSFSRISWLVTSTIILIYLYKAWTRDLLKQLAWQTIVSCATILVLWSGLLFTRVESLPGSNSYLERINYNSYALEVIQASPVFGVGLGNYIPQMIQMFHVQPWQYQPPHNIFLYIGVQLGLIGIGLFVLLLMMIFRRTWAGEKSELRSALLILGFSVLFISLFDHFFVTIQQGQLMFALVLGLMAGYVRDNDNNYQHDDQKN